MTLAWDCGLKLGHRVHEIQEIAIEVQSDITIKTSILESIKSTCSQIGKTV